MDREYLLTYNINNGGFDFEWFDTEEELRERACELGNNVAIIDAVHIKDADGIEF